MTNGWEDSAAAWIASQGERGDFGRQYVLDPVMLPRALASRPSTALDVGCGEGRFCRMLRAKGIDVVGVDPTRNLIDAARQRDPEGRYVEAGAEALPFPSASFDLVVSYMALVDIPDASAAIAEMARVLRHGGHLLIANSTSFNTAGMEHDWRFNEHGERVAFQIDNYLDARVGWVEWKGIRIVNYHRPLATYMQLLLEQGLQLKYFDEPSPTAHAAAPRAREYRRAPWFLVMEWTKA
jgi:SAM-dependent methyltransferase